MTIVFRGPDLEMGCSFTQPQMIRSRGEEFIFLLGDFGDVVALDPTNGEIAWSFPLPPPSPAEVVRFLATPAIVGSLAVAAYELRDADTEVRLRQFLIVIDLEARDFASDFEEVPVLPSVPNFDGSGIVEFYSATQAPRGALKHVDTPDTTLGLVYVPFGGPGTAHPWHGWLLEMDLDAWRADGPDAAIASVFVTTAEQESDCGVRGTSGGREAICGGGIWTHAGPQVVETDTGYEIFVSTGNGQLDFGRSDYANTVLRLERGLAFEPACDDALCADFNPLDPATDCLESCRNVFVPRLGVDDPPLAPADGSCDGLTFQECYAWMDMDLGSCAPLIVTVPGGPRVVLQCGKDGGAYMFDAEHFGLLYDRHQMVELCGTESEECPVFWLGVAATQAETAIIDGELVVIFGTNQVDRFHPAGMVALTVVLDADGRPSFERRWEAPPFDSEEAVRRFRTTYGRPIVLPFGEDAEPYVWVVEQAVPGRVDQGRLWGVRVRDGRIAVELDLDSWGLKFVQPLAVDDTVYFTSCEGGRGELSLTAFRIESAVD